MKDSWNLALTISLLIHILIFTGLPPIHKKGLFFSKVKSKEIIINPQKIKKIIKKKNSDKYLTPPPYNETLMKKIMIDNQDFFFSPKYKLINKNIKDVILTNIDLDKSMKKSPAYMGYYRLIRERIRRNAYRYYDGREKGYVFLKFTVSKKGDLESIYLDSSVNDNYKLKEVAVKSIKDSSPFPPFPPSLNNFSRLQFNISIYFNPGSSE